MSDVTWILQSIDAGDPVAAEELLPLVYEELRRLAAAKIAQERPGQTLQPTALVHEAWLKLVGGDRSWNNRQHFIVAAAEAMRRILVDRARRRQVRERAGYSEREELEDSQILLATPPEQILAIHEALEELECESANAAVLVKLRYFAGMTLPEAAEAMNISLRNAERTWTFARTWLRRALKV